MADSPLLELDDAEDLLVDLTDRVKLIANSLIAATGYSDVFKALLQDHDGFVVIKVIRGTKPGDEIEQQTPDPGSETSETSSDRARRRFRREGRLWPQLVHPNVLPCLGCWFDENPDAVPGLVSPFCKSGNAFNYANGKPEARLDLIIGTAKGLEFLHSKGVIHGDMKGRNVLVDDLGIARVTDFGFSRVLEQSGYTTDLSATSVYMAPELMGVPEGEPEMPVVTQASDVYAFGMVVLELLTGKPPWYGYPPCNVLLRVAQGQRPVRHKYGTLGDTQWDLMQDCWAHKSAERPAMVQIVPRLIAWQDPQV